MCYDNGERDTNERCLPCFNRNYSVLLGEALGRGNFFLWKLLLVLDIENKGDDRNNERTKNVQFFMCNHTPHPLYFFLREKVKQGENRPPFLGIPFGSFDRIYLNAFCRNAQDVFLSTRLEDQSGAFITIP